MRLTNSIAASIRQQGYSLHALDDAEFDEYLAKCRAANPETDSAIAAALQQPGAECDGVTTPSTQTVVIRDGLPEWRELVVLAHELQHVIGHDEVGAQRGTLKLLAQAANQDATITVEEDEVGREAPNEGDQ